MRGENSVVTALAELGRMEQERVEGERRRAAELRVRRLEEALAQDANQRVERELVAASGRLRAEHEAREAELRDRIQTLESQLLVARASSDALHEALLTRVPAVEPRAHRGYAAPLFALLACAVAGWALVQNARLVERVRAPEPTTPAVLNVAPAAPEVVPVAEAAPVTPEEPVVHAKPQPSPQRPPKSTVRPKREKPAEDPLGPIEDCKDDPTCGL